MMEQILPPYVACMQVDVSVSESSSYPPFEKGKMKGFLGSIMRMYPLLARGAAIRGQIQIDQEQQAQGIVGDVNDFDPTYAVVKGVVGEPLAMVAQPVPSNLLLTFFSIYESDDSMVAEPPAHGGNSSDTSKNKHKEAKHEEVDELEIESRKVMDMFDDMRADFNVLIAVILDEMKVKKREERAKVALEVA
ncbi:hypothetical protein AMTR_s00002p00227620 [Amborella trichopoda]|uniref:Uncharacterized protein n=1 Tax=Amborella trichopoda TaxID=13333 RepID=W1NZU3_AMBTC|nr:hypothetical protein AMTR_s00002p00227620 [Amborella trichopoda]